MDENRPSKKQHELLSFIEEFIKANGYGPSYREVMRALDYKSVSTVAVHVDGLIARGWLRKTDHSARSLEVVNPVRAALIDEHISWLEAEVRKRARSESESMQKEAEVLRQALGFLRDPRAS